jgi:hypothetical protein
LPPRTPTNPGLSLTTAKPPDCPLPLGGIKVGPQIESARVELAVMLVAQRDD